MGCVIQLTTTNTADGTAETAVPLPPRTGSSVQCQLIVNRSAPVKTPTRKKMKAQGMEEPAGWMMKTMKTMAISLKEAAQKT